MEDILRINRAKWRTGDDGQNKTGKGKTKLLNPEGFMCCLGFRCNQLGIPKTNLLNVSDPDSLERNGWEVIPDLVKSFEDMGLINTQFCQDAMGLNDDEDLTTEQREKKIKHHFAKKKIKVVFYGEYVEPA